MTDSERADEALIAQVPTMTLTEMVAAFAAKVPGFSEEKRGEVMAGLATLAALVRTAGSGGDLAALLGGNQEAAQAVRAFMDSRPAEERALIAGFVGEGKPLAESLP